MGVEDIDIEDKASGLSIDGLVAIVQQTILDKYGCWGPFLYYLLNDFMYGGVSQKTKYSALFGCAICFVHMLLYLNQLIISGRPRKLDASTDLVVITGGSSGLGFKLAATFIIRGYQVVSLDVVEPMQKMVNLQHIKCDISKENEVRRAADEILTVTNKSIILINNAGIVAKKKLLEMENDEIERTIRINLLGHFWTVRSFLPTMLKDKRGGYVVTISSVLGYVGPAGLTAYCASKGGLNVFHDSLTHEIGSSNVKTLLVTIGQMDSKMFEDVETPNEFLAPILQSSHVALNIVQTMERGYGGELSFPLYAQLINWTKVVPRSLFEIVRTVFGMDTKALNEASAN